MTMKTVNEAAGKVYMGKNLKPEYDINTLIEQNKQEKELEKVNALLLEAEKNKQKEIDDKIKNLELMPVGARLIISPYPRNPYRKIMEGSILVDYSGKFDNPESGETDQLKESVSCGKVLEVGPTVQWIAAGDDVYFDPRTVRPLPFMGLGYVVSSEHEVLGVINEKLKERFKEMK